MGPTQKKMGPARPLTWVKHHPCGHLKSRLPPVPRAYQLVQILQILVPNYSSLCLLSDFLRPDQPGSKGWGPGARTHSSPLRQSEDTRYLVGRADGTGVAAAAAVKTGPSSGSEESKGEKELPEGKGASASHPCGAGTGKGRGPRSS